MDTNSFIVKFADLSIRDEGKLRKIQGEMDASNFVKILDNAQLDANPRDAKKGSLTEDICETLEKTPELFHYKSKGILLSSKCTEILERQRVRINIKDPDVEGILDGGHNSLAIALYLLDKLEETKNVVRSIKRWKDLRDVWGKYSDPVKELLKGKDFSFLVPVEIITTKNNDEYSSFVVDILDIARARNNNAQLTEETKANKAGYYEDLKQFLPDILKDQFEWRTNDGGRIKTRDLVALAMIPLSLISQELADETINPIDIYSSKGKCVQTFNEIFEHDRVSKETTNGIRKAYNKKFISALKLTADIPAIYDMLFEEVPGAYNTTSPGYGRITVVKVYDPLKAKENKKENKYLKRRPKSKYFQTGLDYDSPEGFIVPLLWGLTSLIGDDGEKLFWKVPNPLEFLKSALPEIMKLYAGTMKSAEFDPQRVGKNSGSYEIAAFVCRHLLKN
jgi:hypothetical protein